MIRQLTRGHGVAGAVSRWAVNLLIVAVIAGVGLWYWQQASQAEKALCALSLDLEVRVGKAERYLADVEAGRRKPIPNLTTSDVRDGINNQRRTIKALSILDCKTMETT